VASNTIKQTNKQTPSNKQTNKQTPSNKQTNTIKQTNNNSKIILFAGGISLQWIIQ
jgi:hypothetical protein